MDEGKDGMMDGLMDGCDGWMDEWSDGSINEWMDGHSGLRVLQCYQLWVHSTVAVICLSPNSFDHYLLLSILLCRFVRIFLGTLNISFIRCFLLSFGLERKKELRNKRTNETWRL